VSNYSFVKLGHGHEVNAALLDWGLIGHLFVDETAAEFVDVFESSDKLIIRLLVNILPVN